MSDAFIVGGVVGFLFVLGFDSASYMIMKKVDPLYKPWYRWLLGYNTYRAIRRFKDGL
jgi:hypothetical protein